MLHNGMNPGLWSQTDLSSNPLSATSYFWDLEPLTSLILIDTERVMIATWWGLEG